MTIGPARFRRWLVDAAVWLSPSEVPRRMRDITDTLRGTSKTIYREQVAVMSQTVAGHGLDATRTANLMQLLRTFGDRKTGRFTYCLTVRANARSDVSSQLSDDELAAQMAWVLVPRFHRFC